jgi:hypothetical protein
MGKREEAKAVCLIVFLLSLVAWAKNPDYTYNATAAADGQATDFIYNYLDPDSTGKDIWTMQCVQQPCHLFHKGDKVTLTMYDKPGKVRVGSFRSEKFIIGKLCGAPTGCFKAAFIAHKP